MPNDRNTQGYKRARAELLRDNPVCYWCRKAPATEADHLVEADQGGTHLDGMVPSCKSCNAKRGANYVNRKNAARVQARNQAIRRQTQAPDQDFFKDSNLPTPVLRESYIPKETETDGLGLDSVDLPELGREAPRLVTRSVSFESFGPLVAEFAARHLKPLMPWQEMVLNGQLEHTNGQLCHRESVVSTARQQGKSVALSALAGWWTTGMAALRGEPQTVVVTANKLDRASGIFRDLAPILESMGGKVFWSYGRERVEMPDGSLLKVAAAVPNFHGASIDLIVVDELWNVSPAVLFDALRPSMIARPNPLLSAWSTAGDESSAALLQLREQAIATIENGRLGKLYYAEWSPPPGVDWHDRRYWAWANPALGRTVTWEALEAAAESPNKNAFLRAHLNLWVAAAGAWLPLGVFEQGRTSDPMPDGGILSVDSSVDGGRYVGILASSENGRTYVRVAFMVEREAECWAEIARIMENPKIALAITPTLDTHLPPNLEKRRQVVGYGELVKFTSLVRNMILEGHLAHYGEVSLAEHVARAVLSRTQGTVTLSSQKSPGPIELARCMVWAAALASKPTIVRRPLMATSNSRQAR